MPRSVPLPALAATAAAALLTLGACGGSGGSDGGDPSATPSAEATATPAPGALTGFACVAGSDGLWVATGTIGNTSDEAASYTVDVYVGPADGQDRPAYRGEFENVQPGGSTPLQVTGLAAQGEPATCHVRVLQAVSPGDAEEE